MRDPLVPNIRLRVADDNYTSVSRVRRGSRYWTPVGNSVIKWRGVHSMQETFSDLPEIEYLGGRPFPKVSPKRVHGLVQFAIARILRECGADRGQTVPEWRVRLSRGTELVPDVAFVSYGRLRALTDEAAEEPPFAPDIAVEVRSTSHRAGYAHDKIIAYLKYGGVLVLDIDPKKRKVHAHCADGSVRTYGPGESFTHDAVLWLRFNVDSLFEDIVIPR